MIGASFDSTKTSLHDLLANARAGRVRAPRVCNRGYHE